MRFGDVLRFSGKLVAKTGLLVGEMACEALGSAVSEAEKRGIENKSNKSFEEQRGLWKNSANKLSELNKKIKF